MNTYDAIYEKYPRCEFCNCVVIPEDEYVAVLSNFRYLDTCNGEQYMQEDPFSAEIYGDYTLVLICDGEAEQRAMDI